MSEIGDGEIRKIDKFSYNVGKEYTIEKTKISISITQEKGVSTSLLVLAR